MKGNIQNLDLFNINAYIQNLVKICPIDLKLLNEKWILTSIKDHNSATNLREMTKQSMLDFVNMNAHTKLGEIVSTCSQDIERKQNSEINEGPLQICENDRYI